MHSLFTRTMAPYFHQAKVWLSMLEELKYSRVIFLHSSDEEGRAMLGSFQSGATDIGVEVRAEMLLLLLLYCSCVQCK